MIRFLIDADLPRSVSAALRERGFLADDVRDLDLGTATDNVILHYARTHAYTLVSADKGFTNLVRYPLGSHCGIVVARFSPHTSARMKTRLLVRWLPTLQDEDVAGSLLIVQPKGIRIRRAKQ